MRQRNACTVDMCDRPQVGRELCALHYKRQRKHGHPGSAAPLKVRITPGELCSVDGCDRPMGKVRLCDGHYQRLRKTDSVGSATFLKRADWTGVICSVDSCGRPVVAKELCKPHFYRQHYTGTVSADVPLRVLPPPGTTCGVDGCSRLLKSNGLCVRHESQRRAAMIKADPVRLEAERRYQREFKAAEQLRNPERVRARSKAWRAANPDRVKLFDATKRHKRRSVPRVRFTPDQLAAKLHYWGGRCWICDVPYMAIDHVKPVSKGGWHMLANLRPICGPCNSSKTNRWPYSNVLALRAKRRQALALT